MNAHYLEVKKTARYFTLGAMNKHTTEVWFLLHGYAQLASDFLEQFYFLDNGKRLLIAPEGLNKFYARGFGGKPAANWMTSEERIHEISDYLHYLNALYQSFKPEEASVKIILLGFSQGVATASRWLAHGNAVFHHFIICSGEIASELQEPLSASLQAQKITYITGKQDKLIPAAKLKDYYTLMHRLQANIIEFDGGHTINKESIEKAAQKLSETA